MTTENLVLKDQLTQLTYNLHINRFEEDLSEQQIKVNRLETFNKDLRSKVDYFISLIQQMNLSSLSATV